MPKLEFNAEYMQNGYWGNHTPKDGCPYIRIPYPRRGITYLLQEDCAAREAEKLAADSLSTFFETGSRVAIRTFRTGQEFQGTNHTLGTIVEFEREDLYLEMRAKRGYGTETFYDKTTSWGVIAQMDFPEPNRTVLMVVRNGLVGPNGRAYPHLFVIREPNLEVGKVIHRRNAEDRDHYASESFHRVNSLTMWVAGTATRRPFEQRGRLHRLLHSPFPI